MLNILNIRTKGTIKLTPMLEMAAFEKHMVELDAGVEVFIDVWTPFLSPLPRCIADAVAWMHCMAYIDG